MHLAEKQFEERRQMVNDILEILVIRVTLINYTKYLYICYIEILFHYFLHVFIEFLNNDKCPTMQMNLM